MEEKKMVMPLIPLKDMVILPGMMVHFDVNRELTRKAVETAIEKEQKVFIVLQKESEQEDISRENLAEVGVVAYVKQLVRMPKDGMRVMVMAIEPAWVSGIHMEEGIYYAEITETEDISLERFKEVEQKGLLDNLRELFEAFSAEEEHMSQNVRDRILKIRNLDKLVKEVAINVIHDNQDRQNYLEQEDDFTRYVFLVKYLMQAIEVLKIKKDLQQKLKAAVDKNQREYYMREQMKVIRNELGETDMDSEADDYLAQVEELLASEEIKEKIRLEIRRFRSLPSGSENAVSRSYIETLLELPWDKKTEDYLNIAHAEKVLERDHYGMEKVKERILEFLSVRALTQKGDAPIICLVGPPGTGKTSIARSVAEALHKKYVRICLGGVRDEAEIRGHRRTYVGAMPGRIIEGIKNAGVRNPLMLLDEIDKTGNDRRGDTASALLEVLDNEQNIHFKDHYVELPVDLSEVLFIATANNAGEIPRPLLDRMEVIEIAGYTENEKFHIAKDHLVKKQLEKNGITRKQFSITDKALRKIIAEYTKEAGVRGLERKISAVMRKAAKQILEAQENQETESQPDKIKVTDKNLSEYLGMPTYEIFEKNKKPQVGVVRGLAWTSVGGVTLETEAVTLPGNGKLILTGKLGEVMQESAKASLGYIRSVAEKHSIEADYFKNNDIHVHIPEGATPKDGPSAGITMTLAMLSAITKRKVRADLAMTGEVTLTGRILPIGGLKEKLLAAKHAHMAEVLVPRGNEKTVSELEEEVKKDIKITYIEHMDEVWGIAFVS